MALDHIRARSSAINVNCPWRQHLIIPDGSLSAQDRAQADYMYILASGSSVAPAVSGTNYRIIPRIRRR